MAAIGRDEQFDKASKKLSADKEALTRLLRLNIDYLKNCLEVLQAFQKEDEGRES